VFHAVIAVDKFDFRLVINEITNGDQQKDGHAMIQTHVFDRIHVFSSAGT
jgi:hypothetical protein